ncbi:LysR family transcriptional regulator [Burkholderia ubonensis]|uniref:LysR family transcriptional regulator n=1 Tax=Burkholderia ubonensis TaxID=101571 RepID=UPI002AB1E9E9|nr:LysR family transcriptional regulator [Burkholderia ubonensis]
MDLFVSMEAFVCAADARSFSDAARRLGVARSVVTARIQQLEAHFGVALFHRSTRAVRLSEIGERCYRECVEIITRVDKLSGGGLDEPETLSGTLNVHVLTGFALGQFPQALADFCAKHPLIRVSVTVDDRVIDPVQDGFDLAIQIYAPASDQLVERRMFPVRGVLCATPDYLNERQWIETPLDLQRARFARYAHYPWGDTWPFSNGNKCVEVVLEPILKSNSVHLLLEFARASAGIAYLPTMVASADLLAGRLVHVLPGYAAPPLWLSAVYPASHRSTTKVKAFLHYLQERFPSETAWDRALGIVNDRDT